MKSIDVIKNKIAELGGVKRNPLCPSDDNLEVSDSFLQELEGKIGNKLPESYVTMIKYFGAFSFQKLVKTKFEDLHPVTTGNNATVNYFYALKDEGECSINKLLTTFSTQLPNYFLPICDGEPGDLICIDCRADSYEHIYYWWHEAEVGNELFLVAKNFIDFICKLEIVEDESDVDEGVKVKIEATDKLLEMLRKSGYGPKS
jgi:hypothetical protein